MNETTANILLSVLLGILLILFIGKSTRTKHIIPYFPFSFAFLFIGTFVYLILSQIFPSLPQSKLVAIELMFFGLSLFFLYLFLESVNVLSVRFSLFLVIFSFLIIQQISLLFVIFSTNSQINTDLHWFFADLAYNSIGVIINLGIGFPFYLKNFNRNHSKISMILVAAFLILTVGYVSLWVADIAWYFSILQNFQDIIFEIGKLFPIVGLIIILLVYVSDINHFYQVNSNLFVVMISDLQGNIIFQSKYENIHEKIAPLDTPIPQLLNVVNKLFANNFESRSSINLIKSEDVSMIRKVGKIYSAVIVSNKVSKMLEKALIRFLESFEEKFGNQPSDYFHQSQIVEEIVALLVSNFPFLTPL